jgi:predicted glycosyltransferase
MGKRFADARILLYSHDTFGLGHLQRCRTIAHALVERHKGLSVLIISGSPIIGSFEFRTRVDFVRVPGVFKLRNGEYSPLSLHMDIAAVVRLRSAIIRHTTEAFRPDLFIVDKEPLGLRGEVAPALRWARSAGTRLVLGLRDVLDDPALLAEEWRRKNLVPSLERFYDELWVYGLPQMGDPLEGIEVPETVRARMVYTGYLRRDATLGSVPEPPFDEPWLLVTTGGGGDGHRLVDWVLSAYEHAGGRLPHPALILLGPFMPRKHRERYLARAARLPRVKARIFDAQADQLLARAAGVVAMGGYNTFCEILSFDKPALIVPRRRPRREQLIRAQRAAALGLVRLISEAVGRDPERMVQALRSLPTQPGPLSVPVPGLLDGLENISRLVERRLEVAGLHGAPRPEAVVRALPAGQRAPTRGWSSRRGLP